LTRGSGDRFQRFSGDLLLSYPRSLRDALREIGANDAT
jgi:hypothetical protein